VCNDMHTGCVCNTLHTGLRATICTQVCDMRTLTSGFTQCVLTVLCSLHHSINTLQH
jgi:hypothetical protein